MKICGWGNSSGSKYWRLEDPFKYLRRRGIDAHVSSFGINDIEGDWADIAILQGCVDMKGIAFLLQHESDKALVVDCDDNIAVAPTSPFKKEHDMYDAKEIVSHTIQVADMVTATTPYLARKLKKLNKNVVVLPNYIDQERWDLPYMENDTGKIRIGWAGSITHVEDMEMIVEPLRRICKEFKKVQLVMVGDTRVGNLFDGLPVENMMGTDFDAWPSKLYSLRLDIGLAPLRDTEFNRCKSNIKWLEYSIARIPGVYSPTVYADNYDFDGVYGQIARTPDQWYRCIKNYIICENLRRDIASRARAAVVTGYTLKTNIKKWVKAYNKLIRLSNGYNI